MHEEIKKEIEGRRVVERKEKKAGRKGGITLQKYCTDE